MSLNLSLLGLLWLSYFALHSLFASLWLKSRVSLRWPGLMPGYRLMFNLLALLLLIPPLAMMGWLDGEPLWRYGALGDLLRFTFMGLAIAGFAWSLHFYDGREFIGIRQLKQGLRDIEDQERLHISPLHRFVRHPWYALGLILVWTQEMDAARLVSAGMITGYLVIGSLLEERKLMIYHGVRYQRYRERVPGLVPLPHRYLTRDEAVRILEEQ